MRDRRFAFGEPFHFLQFHPVPRRVADDGVEAALPILPDGGESQFPMQKMFLIRFGNGLLHDAMRLLFAGRRQSAFSFGKKIHRLEQIFTKLVSK